MKKKCVLSLCPLSTMPENIIRKEKSRIKESINNKRGRSKKKKTFQRNTLMLTRRFTVKQTFRSRRQLNRASSRISSFFFNPLLYIPQSCSRASTTTTFCPSLYPSRTFIRFFSVFTWPLFFSLFLHPAQLFPHTFCKVRRNFVPRGSNVRFFVSCFWFKELRRRHNRLF